MSTAFIIDNLTFLTNGPYSLSLSEGECCGLIGDSGVGKSLFLRAIADVLVHSGECFLLTTPCSSFSPQEWRKKVALVPAESFWWYDSVGAHFTAAERESNFFTELIVRFGFSTDVLQWQISRLSTGERQRLSLIRTLITKPQILLLDEPTSGLDAKMTEIVEDVIGSICLTKKSCCLWVSHDPEQLSRVTDCCFQVEHAALVEIQP